MAYKKADYFGIISKTSAVDYLETLVHFIPIQQWLSEL